MKLPNAVRPLSLMPAGLLALSTGLACETGDRGSDPKGSAVAAGSGPTAAVSSNAADAGVEQVLLGRRVTFKDSVAKDSDWVVGAGGSWVPALDPVTLGLAKVQGTLRAGDRSGAADELDAASKALTNLNGGEPEAVQERDKIARQLAEDAKSLRTDTAPVPPTLGARIEEAARVSLQQNWAPNDNPGWLPYAERPAEHMQWAKQYYLAGERAVAARHTAKTAALLEALALRLDGSVQPRLRELAAQLLTIRQKVAVGALRDVAQLDASFGQVELALATYHIQRSAALSVRDSGSQETRQHLYLSAKYLSYQAKRQRADLGPLAQEALESMSSLTTKIAGNRRLSSGQVTAAVGTLKSTLRQLSRSRR